MPEKFIIAGDKKLSGIIKVNGSKNGASACLAACLLTEKECVLNNLPLVKDILNLLELIKEMGVAVEWVGERSVKIKAKDIDPSKMNYEKFSKARTSVLLIGALLARFKNFKVSRPGGDRIGLRPITTHLQAFEDLGVSIEEQGDFYCFKTKGLKVAEIVLSEFSVTATENLLLAVSLIEGETIIKTAAAEPHIQDLVLMLNEMGCDIVWQGQHILKINGKKQLNRVEHNIIPDYIESGTFIIAGALMGDNLKIENAVLNNLDLFLAKMAEAGVDFKKQDDGAIILNKSENLKAIKIQALPYPGFPTDLLPLAVPFLTQCHGKCLIHDPLYENRLNYVQELRKMGADIEIVDPHRAFVFGKTPLRGVSIESWDIRAGASLLLTGLLAKGQTTISNIEQIDRGYERIEERLAGIGADIKRVVV